MKKTVIAYLHTHWDREWYREFEVFRLRLVRVFDRVLDLLENNKIPSFYFDGQVVALLDYLEIRPEKEQFVRELIKKKKLFIGPFYCLVDEFLTDDICFSKNLEIGLKISRDFGCEDFIGYLADTFGHSKNIPPMLNQFGIDKAVVWRGVPKDIPSEFVFNGVNTVNLVRGYFNDLFSQKCSADGKADKLKKELDLIAEKSSDYLLLPIGADHLGVETDICKQINDINRIFKAKNISYEIKLSNPFEYFEKVNFSKKFDDELRDNSNTFILQGAYSARNILKKYNTQCSYMLNQADKVQKKYGNRYSSQIEYAYKLLLKNQAHDGICGCSTDEVHQENSMRYKKILQVANAIIEELRLDYNFKTPFVKSDVPLKGYDIVSEDYGFENSLLYDTQRIPVTEDYKKIYNLHKSPKSLYKENLILKRGKLFIGDVEIRFSRRKDRGDTYNFGAVKGDKKEFAKILSIEGNLIKTNFFDIEFFKSENLINFVVDWNNRRKNTLWQAEFILPNAITDTYSEDFGKIIRRKFDPDYNMYDNLPKTRGIEVRTNFAPMQRLVFTQGFGVITKGLTEYEVCKNSLAVTMLRSVGVISNKNNPSRTTPAGPPLKVPEAQQLGRNICEFAFGFFDLKDCKERICEVYPDYV